MTVYSNENQDFNNIFLSDLVQKIGLF